MTISIKSYQTSIPVKAPAQEKSGPDNTEKSELKRSSLSSVETVSISSSAQALYAQTNAAEHQAPLSKNELGGLYTKGQNNIYSFGILISSGNYNKEDLLPETDDPDRLALGQKALDYSVGLSKLPPEHYSNPFAGMARNDLSAIVYDDSGTYTDAERYAAYGELSKQDYEYFSELFAKITNGGDNREVFKGILDYFDDLPPVEQSAYPDGFRDNIDGLYQEQLDQWGPLALIKQSAEQDSEKTSESIFTQEQSSAEMLQAILQKTISAQQKVRL